MSPLVDAECLSDRGSRERHCDRNGIPSPFGSRFPFLRFGHHSSTFLLPLAPPRFAARLHRYYESSDFCRAASIDVTGIAKFVPLRRAILRRQAWAIGQAVSLAAGSNGSSSTSCTRQISLLIAFDLPTIPSPTTISPFRHGRFRTLLHRRDLPCLSPGQTQRSVGLPSHGQGFGHCQQPPRQAWPNRVHIRYGLVVRLRLLSTLPHGNAVTTFDYRLVTFAWEGLPPS